MLGGAARFVGHLEGVVASRSCGAARSVGRL